MDLATKRVVVTGGAGFLGRHVVEELERHGCRPFVPRSRDYDLATPDGVERLYADSKPQCVIHLAAVCGGIGINRKLPGTFFYQNLMMGTLLLERARQLGVEKFVGVGTVCSYPKFTPVPFKEADIWNGYPEETNAPYGLAKKALLVQAQAYRQQYGFNAIYLIPTNLYGPGDNFDLESGHVIPALIRKCVEARDAGRPAIECWGTGSATREFLYAGDAARGIVRAAQRYDGGEPCNLGSSEEISIRQLVELVATQTGYAGRIEWNSAYPDGQPRRKVDDGRARELFGYRPEVDLAEGLKRTIAWYEQHIRQPVTV